MSTGDPAQSVPPGRAGLSPTPRPRRDLPKALGMLTATAIVVGSVVGSGVFKKAAPMAAELPSPSLVLLLWIAAAAISFLGALCAAELAKEVFLGPGWPQRHFPAREPIAVALQVHHGRKVVRV